MVQGTQIGPGTHVTLAYTLYDEEGDVVEEVTAEDPVTYVHGYGQLVPGLERAIEGMVAGQSREVLVEAADGFGEHDPENVLEVERGEFPNADGVRIGDEFVAEGPDGAEIPVRVLEINDESLIVDTNHPLAGQTLRFEVAVRDVRPATSDEIADAEDLLEAAEHEGCSDEDHDHDHDHHHEAPVQLIQLGAKPKKTPTPS